MDSLAPPQTFGLRCKALRAVEQAFCGDQPAPHPTPSTHVTDCRSTVHAKKKQPFKAYVGVFVCCTSLMMTLMMMVVVKISNEVVVVLVVVVVVVVVAAMQ